MASAHAKDRTKDNECEPGLIIRKPKVVCLCGSTKFADIHAVKKWELEQSGGIICLMISYIPRWYADQQGYKEPDHIGEQAGVKPKLDELHLRKIDLADEIFVINVGGYIGKSTYNEICYAKEWDKPVKFLEGVAVGDGIYYRCKEDWECEKSMFYHKRGNRLSITEYIFDTEFPYCLACRVDADNEIVLPQFHISAEHIFRYYERVE